MLSRHPRCRRPSATTARSERRYPACGVACADELEAVHRCAKGPETVAAFIAEPVLGASAGAAVPPEDYARRVREICRATASCYIDDEVMTGFGRTGRWFGDRVERRRARPRDLREGHERGLHAGGRGAGQRARRGDAGRAPAASPTGSRSPTTRSPPPPAWPPSRSWSGRASWSAPASWGRSLGAAPGPAPRASARGRRAGPRPDVGGRARGGPGHAPALPARRAARRRPWRPAASRAASSSTRARGCATGTEGDLVMVAPPFVVTDDAARRSWSHPRPLGRRSD